MGDWRTFRARLTSLEAAAAQPMSELVPPPPGRRWAHMLAGPEQGCVLLASGDDMGALTNSVVFVLGHHGAFQVA